jgi:ubiquinone/menaquinone biosynthesis C-methylase UbiE
MAGSEGLKSKDLFPAIFSRHALAYQRRMDDIMSRNEARGRMRAIELVDAMPGMRILDLACGPGTLSRRLAAQVAPDGEIVGVDLASGMVDLARASAIPNTRFEVMDIERLDFADASFDAAICGHALQFTADLERALREAHRVIRAGGRFTASVPVSPVSKSVWRLLDSVIDRHLPPAPVVVDQTRTRETVGDVVAFRQAALDAGFVEAGVEVIEEKVHWESADHLVSMFTSWWDCASRLEGVGSGARDAFVADATATLQREHPGAIETTGVNHVLVAVV